MIRPTGRGLDQTMSPGSWEARRCARLQGSRRPCAAAGNAHVRASRSCDATDSPRSGAAAGRGSADRRLAIPDLLIIDDPARRTAWLRLGDRDQREPRMNVERRAGVIAVGPRMMAPAPGQASSADGLPAHGRGSSSSAERCGSQARHPSRCLLGCQTHARRELDRRAGAEPWSRQACMAPSRSVTVAPRV